MAGTTELADEEVGRSPLERRTDTSSRRSQLAQLLGLVALTAALVGALGPAKEIRTKYSWPPATLPSGTPSRAWYSPLLLIRHRTESLSASVPCSLPPALADAEQPVTVLATSRFPEQNSGLAVARSGSELVVKVGRDVLARADLSDGRAGKACAYQLRVQGDRWSLEGGPDGIGVGGRLGAVPVVFGLFSSLDLSQGLSPSVEVTTAVHATESRLRQSLAWTVAVLCISAALLLVALERRPRPWRTVRDSAARAAVNAHPADAVVALILLGWWVVSPSFHDDGWVIARERMFAPSGGFASYYNAFGTNYPNDYWLEWAQHWLLQSSSSLLLLRVPALLCLGTTWVLCRWILARLLDSSARENGAALWALTSTFLLGSLAWGMTLRPEPVSALFVTAVMACTVRFVEKGTAAPLALAAVLLPLAFTAHHAALVGLAPLLVVSPSVLRWARSRLATASTIAAASIALLAVLLFLGSDLEQRRADARTLARFTGVSWRSEPLRYASLADFPFATPVRRATVALMLLAVLAFVLRRRRDRAWSLPDLPAASLGVALLLLVLTPSKFPWHFGALLGVAAIAVAAETARLRAERPASGRWVAKPLIVLGAAITAVSWSWSPRTAWSTLDLRTLDWTPAFEDLLPLSTLGILVPLVVLLGAVLVARGNRTTRAFDAPWSVASWIAPIVAAPLLVFTVAVFAVDALKTSSWTLTRQNLGAVRGDVGCGLADDLLVPDRQSFRAVSSFESRRARPLPAWVPAAPLDGLPRFALGPTGQGLGRSPWFDIRDRPRFGLFISGTAVSTDRLILEWGRRMRGERVERVASDEVAHAFASEAGAVLPWRFLAAGELPAPPRGMIAVRVALLSDGPSSAGVAVTAPVVYTTERLAEVLARPGARPLIFPNLVTYFPCAHLARLHGGAAEVPSQILVPTNVASPVREPDSSPFAGVLDLYRLERMPLADSRRPTSDFVVFDVVDRIPGATIAPAVQETIAS
jgi:hypothetical protein